ncbi:MAG: preprotein translocase subunit SecF [Cellvibrionaceae bacterium]|jgi:preprotein translocase subunit SecF
MGESKKKMTEKNPNKVINFMGRRFIALSFSIFLMLGSLVSLAINGLQFGLEFTGGLQIEVQFKKPVNLSLVRETLNKSGISDATVVYFGSDKDIKITTQEKREDIVLALLAKNLSSLSDFSVENVRIDPIPANEEERLPEGGTLITLQNSDRNIAQKIDAILSAMSLESYQQFSAVENSFEFLTKDDVQIITERLLLQTLESATGDTLLIKRTEFVGPQVGNELRDQGGIGLLIALAVVMIYVALRFQFKFSVGAVAALIHDVVIVLGFFSVFKLDFDPTVLAAILAVIGYSLNDTIVVSDRIRENFRRVRKSSPMDIINESLTQTLGRTLVTSLTTLLVLVALLIVGGELIRTFSIALIVGIFIGTYSSIYVAANTLLLMNISKEDLMVPDKEGAELNDLP